MSVCVRDLVDLSSLPVECVHMAIELAEMPHRSCLVFSCQGMQVTSCNVALL